MPPVDVPPLDPRVYELLGEFPRELFDLKFYRSWELVDRYAREWAVRLAQRLGLGEVLAVQQTADELRERLGFVAPFAPALEGLLRQLHAGGILVREAAVEADEGRVGDGRKASPAYRLTAPLPADGVDEVRAACLEHDPRNAPALDLLDLAGNAYPAVARGEVDGQAALFGLGQTRIWLAYFHNDNPTYAINNRIAARVAVNRLAAEPGRGRAAGSADVASDAQAAAGLRVLEARSAGMAGDAQAAAGLRILEVGGGGGSASEALLAELAAAGALDRVARYRFTEPSPFFRRGAERNLRRLHPTLPLEVAALDLDKPFGEQGEVAGDHDLVYAVNVLHVARDLPASLAQLHEVMVPGGLLIAAEALRPHPEVPVPNELVFQLLAGFSGVRLDPERRPDAGFLTADQWRRLLAEAGFVDVEIVPDPEAMRAIYPRFYTGVLVARRPAVG
jgi:SAM-dependent methyltransferase